MVYQGKRPRIEKKLNQITRGRKVAWKGQPVTRKGGRDSLGPWKGKRAMLTPGGKGGNLQRGEGRSEGRKGKKNSVSSAVGNGKFP